MGLQTVDFGAWLLREAVQADHVVVAMDLGAGRGFEVLQGMLSDGSLALVDQLHVRWRYQLSVRYSSRAGLEVGRSTPGLAVRRQSDSGSDTGGPVLCTVAVQAVGM